MIYLDSETVGFTGPMVLLQYAEDNGPIHLHEIFYEPIDKTLELIEHICTQDVCGFNLNFDWFHLTKIYNILRVIRDSGFTGIPTEEQVIQVEAHNPSEFCLRPRSALDLMLVARRDKYQYVMNRKAITVRRVPENAGYLLANKLKDSIDLPAICFAKDAEGYRWRVTRSKDHMTDKELPGLVDVQLRFKGSTSLGALAHNILGEDKADWPIPKELKCTELAWLPYGQHGKRPWGKVISKHIAMWHVVEQARYYAWRDVDITRKLHLEVFPEEIGGDTDSELACALGATRWRGFEIDHDRVRALIPKYEELSKSAPRKPTTVRERLEELLPPVEQLALKNTRRPTLEHIAEESSSEQAREFAQSVLDARQAKYRHTLLLRLLKLPRLHPQFKVIGTKSNRQSGGGEEKSGGGSINPQGIPRDKEIRTCFTFARPNEQLWGGDADSYEVSIMASVFKDENLIADLQSGKKFHALMGEVWYGISYEEMMYEKDLGTGDTKYDKVKMTDFAMMFGADDPKLEELLGVEVEESRPRFEAKYPQLYHGRAELAMSFCSMRQPGGIGTKVEWHEPAEYVESVLGFRRYFTLENQICRTLFRLANKLPEDIAKADGVRGTKVVRRAERGTQTASGAIQSALYASAFGLQAANMRAACNHVIQSPGGQIAKEFQVELWRLQPVGITTWRVRVFNMHDELLAVTDGKVNTVAVKDRVIKRFRETIPLLKWDWERMNTWADK